MQIPQATKGVGHLQQGAIDIMAQSSKQFIGRGIEVNNLTATPKMQTIGGAQDSATAG